MVVFGQPLNFRKERLEFEIVYWESQYHAVLGRPAYAKFMAIPHYAYLQLKILGNNGTPLTIYGDFQRSDNCDREFNHITQGFWRKDHHQPPSDGRPVAADEFNPVEQTKKLQVHTKDPDRKSVV